MRSLAVLLLVAITAEPYGQDRTTALSCSVVVAPTDSSPGLFVNVAEGSTGRLAWSDGRPGQFLLRDSRGVVRVVGRRGAGPGEFDLPGWMSWVGDTVIVSDFRLRRVQFFSDTGRLIRVLTGMVPTYWTAQPDGRIAGLRPTALASELPLPMVLVSQRPGDIKMDTVASFEMPAVERFERVAGRQTVRNQQPFHPGGEVGSSQNGARFCGTVQVGDDSIRLRCTDGAGRIIVDRSVSLSPRPLTSAVYDSVVARFTTGGNIASDLRGRIKRTRYLPLVQSLRVDDGGSPWIQRTHSSEPDAVWTRLHPDGRFRDDVVIPKRFRMVRPEGDIIWLTTADDDGMETLHKCRIGP